MITKNTFSAMAISSHRRQPLAMQRNFLTVFQYFAACEGRILAPTPKVFIICTGQSHPTSEWSHFITASLSGSFPRRLWIPPSVILHITQQQLVRKPSPWGDDRCTLPRGGSLSLTLYNLTNYKRAMHGAANDGFITDAMLDGSVDRRIPLGILRQASKH